MFKKVSNKIFSFLDLQGKNQKPEQPHVAHKTLPEINSSRKHGLNQKQRQFLMKELALLNSSGSKTIFLKSHHKNSSKDFVVFMSTSGSDVEVNKAPQEIKEGGVAASSGLHFEDQYTKRYHCMISLEKRINTRAFWDLWPRVIRA